MSCFFLHSPSDLEADDEDNQDYDSLTMSDSTLSLIQPSGILLPSSQPPPPAPSQKPQCNIASHYHHHHHHHGGRCLSHSSSKYDLLKQSQQHPPALLRGTTYCSGMCSKGGYLIGAGQQQLAANRSSNGRPATPSSENSHEVSRTGITLCSYYSNSGGEKIVRFFEMPDFGVSKIEILSYLMRDKNLIIFI